MIEIDVAEKFQDEVETTHLHSIGEKVLALAGTDPHSEFSVQITDDAVLQKLNHQYMGIDAPTDVLSFPVPFENPDTGNIYLGDILISFPTAVRQSKSAGHPTEEEIALLLVHGILHLLGYDHTTHEEKESMWALQESILTNLKIKARPTE